MSTGMNKGLASPTLPHSCASMAPLFGRRPRMLSYLGDERFLPQAVAHPTLSALFVTAAIEAAVRKHVGDHIALVVVEEPHLVFVELYNTWAASLYVRKSSVIHPTARVHPRAYVAEHNVTVGAGSVIEPNVTVLPDVEIGEHCHIHAGAVLGADGFEAARTSRGLIPIFHDGKLVLGNHVRIGANASIDKGIFGRNTTVGERSTVGPLSYIAHSVQIDADCTLTGTAVVCGTTSIGAHSKIGPNTTVSHLLSIGASAYVRLGAVVTKSVGEGESVSGNFAVPHAKFLENLKKSLT